jgi:hypothetical protein
MSAPSRGEQAVKKDPGEIAASSDHIDAAVVDVVKNNTWGDPSRASLALLKRPDKEPYTLTRLAHSVGRLGLRESYFLSMRQAAVRKH